MNGGDDAPKELFVGNLSFNTDEGSLRRAFGKFGTIVNLKLPTDRMTGKPKGFGFVEFASNKEA